jgi:hypothetical protein
MRQQMTAVVGLQGELNTAIEQGDVSRLNEGYNKLNAVIDQVEQSILENLASIRELNSIQWISPQTIEIFDNGGVERFELEVQSANEMMSRLQENQNTLTQQAQNIDLLPPNAITDISDMNNRVMALQAKIQELSTVQLNDIGADRANNEIESLRERLNQALQVQEQLSNSMNNLDFSGANQALNQFNTLIDGTEQNFRDRLSQIESMDLLNAEWAKPQTIDVIMGEGFERYNQEIQSANSLMNNLITTQQQITQQAQQSHILPPNAVNDIMGLNSRVLQLQQQLQRVEQNALDNVGAD